MKIIRPYARILDSDQNFNNELLRKVEWCGRISHRSEDDQKEDTVEKFLRAVVLGHGDWSIVEHATISVDCIVDRGITHEIVRHRLFSYTQESTRFVNYEKKMPPSFIYFDPAVECEHCISGNEPFLWHEGFAHQVNLNDRDEYVLCPYDSDWLSAIHHAEETYRKLLSKGRRPQEARSVFPNALASRIVMTANLRSWRHFFRMRTTKEAHPQMRQVMIPLLEEFKKIVPILYEDIAPLARQVDNLKLSC